MTTYYTTIILSGLEHIYPIDTTYISQILNDCIDMLYLGNLQIIR